MELEQSKLIQLLKTFNTVELKKFENFLFSPFFNASEQINLLFEILKKDYPNYNKLTKEEIFKTVYPSQQYKDKKVRDLLSRMLGLAEDFLAQEEFSNRKFLKTKFTLRQIASRNLEKHFESKAREADAEIENEKLINSDLLFNRYSIFKEKREFSEIHEGMKKLAIYYQDITQELNLFTAYIIYNILKYEINILANKKQLKYVYEYKILDNILAFCKDNPMDEYPAIMIYYYIITLNRNGGDMNTYLKLKKLIDKNINYISDEDKIFVLVEQFNLTKVQALKGIDFYRKENYRILKQNTDMGIYPMEGSYFNEPSFITIATMALAQKDFEWVENFIDKNIDRLDPKKKENTHTFLKGALNYRKGNYGTALNLLAKVSTDDFSYFSQVKNHQLKIYYETGDYESTVRTAETYRRFLANVKHMPDFVKTRYVNFVNFLSRICNAQLSGHLNNIIDIKNDILSIKQETLENKIWLLEQINKIKI